MRRASRRALEIGARRALAMRASVDRALGAASASRARADANDGRRRATAERRRRTATTTRATRASARAEGGRGRGTRAAARAASGDVEAGDGVAYSRRGEARIGTVERRDGKTGVVVREMPGRESVKVNAKAIDFNFGAKCDCEAMERFARDAAESAKADALLRGAWELIDEFGLESGEVCDATYVSELMFEDDANAPAGAREFAAHRLLSSPMGGIYFKLKAKGTYESRAADQIDALKRKAEAESRAAKVEEAFLDEIKAAAAAPAGVKPDRDALWRPSDEDNDARVRRLEALEAYALGEKFHSAGEKAMADDLLGKLGFTRSSEGALKTLISTGTWSRHENLSVRKYGVQIDFPEGTAKACAEVLSNEPVDADAASRVDLTYLRAYAIDDAETVEVDDAVSAEALGDDGQIRVWVHIADPTRWIPLGSPLDAIARQRATTLYYPTEIVPMFPLEIAAGPMSLGSRSDVASEAMTVRADIDREGNIMDFEIMPSFVKLDRRWTYDEVDVELDSATCDEGLRLLYKVASARDERRAEDGSVTIILPENSVNVRGATARGGDGDVAITMSKINGHTPARMLVSELMVLVGDVVARFGVRENIPLPFRGQGEPRLMSDDEWDGIPEGICQDMAMRSCMTSSTSGATPRPHSGLGLSAYVQFTSPIRRYADVLAHHQIKAYLRGEPLPFDEQSMENVIEDVSTTVGGAIRSQRETSKYWASAYFDAQPADARWTATVVKFIRGDDLVLVIFDDLGYETVVKLDRGAVLGETLTLKFVDADPHAGSTNFARVEA